jgi:hypothetical protein
LLCRRVVRSAGCRDVATSCPVRALWEWLNAAGIVSGSLFRPINKAGTVAASRLTCRSVANIVKEYAGRAGFDAAIFSARSLRSGFFTSAAAKGASIFKMMDQSRAQVDRHPARLCSRCRTIQGSRGAPDCFERQRLRRERQARRGSNVERRVHVNPGWQGWVRGRF